MMSRRRLPVLVRAALAYLTARGFIAVADVSGKHHQVRWISSDGHQHALTLPKDPYGSADVALLARLRRALAADGAAP
jgi:hypothetical protein